MTTTPLVYDHNGNQFDPRTGNTGIYGIAFEEGAEPRDYDDLTPVEQETIRRYMSYLIADEDRRDEQRTGVVLEELGEGVLR